MAEDVVDEIAGFPNLGRQVRTHWIQGNTLFYVKGESIALRDLQSGSESLIPYGAYEVKELIVRGNEIALSAKSNETLLDTISTFIRFAYDAENDIYNGIVCKIDTKSCSVKVSGNYLIRGFQPYTTGYIYSKTEWEDYSFGADIPTDVRSSVMTVSRGVRAPLVEKIGGIHSLFINESNGSIYLDVRNASELSFESGEGVYELVGGLLKKVYLQQLTPRFEDLWSGQMRTNGVSWAIGFGRFVDGKPNGITNDFYCSGKKQVIDSISSIFLIGSTFFYIDLMGVVQKHSC